MISNVNALIVIRFLLGVVESAVMPSMLVFLSMWFTKSERSRANTFLILGIPVTILWMSVLSGYLIDSVGNYMGISMVETGIRQACRCQMADK
jgi:MFS family permease